MKYSVTTKWDGERVKELGKKVVGKSSFEIGLIVEGHAKLLVNNVTGRLAASITTQSKDDGTLPEAKALASDIIDKPKAEGETLVGTPVDYAPDVEFGTAPHTIRIKDAKVLSNGEVFFGEEVHHPGTNANPFLRVALASTQGQSATIVTKIVDGKSKEYFKDYIK